MNGLSLTQSLLLQILAREPASVGDLWRVSQGELEPMPFLGDMTFLHILNEMGRAHPAVYERSVLDPEVVRWMLGRQRETSMLADLTPREHEVLGLLAEGCSNQGAAL